MAADPLLNLQAFTVQVALIAAAAALVLGILRLPSPGARYACWRVALAACVSMPLLLQRPAAVQPSEPWRAMTVEGPATGAGVPVPEDEQDPPLAASARSWPITWGATALWVIAAGAIARGLWLSVGLIHLRLLRRRGAAIDDADYVDLQHTLGTHATLMSVAGLKQPATFGVWRPVVLVPEALAEAPLALRRAVVAHELFHVQRRDWVWVLGEELLRTILWFHPAISWITSRIQLAREELVDELTVLATGNRKAYIEALLTFADAGRVSPAPAFARRRHLFTRIVRLSKERVMSSPRIVTSAASVIAIVIGTGWYASSIFPLVAATPDTTLAQPAEGAAVAFAPHLRETQESLRTLAETTRSTSQTTREPGAIIKVQDVADQGGRRGGARRPGPAAAAPAPGTKPITPENPIPRRLSYVPAAYPPQLRGSGYRGVVTARVTLDTSGRISDIQRLAANVVGGSGAVDRDVAATAFFEASSDALRQWRYQSPADPPIAFFVSVVFDSESAAVASQSDSPAPPVRPVTMADPARREVAQVMERLRSLMEQRSAAERSNPQGPDVATLRQQIDDLSRELEDRARRQQIDDLSRELEGRARLAAASPGQPGAGSVRPVVPSTTTGAPIRVGGNIKPPTRVRNVNADYPEIARSARVQGVVILEIVIDEQGRVAEARVLRSIPLLDQAALDAVRQWEYAPTLLNGAPVPIVMTVTVNFTLSELPPQ